MQINPRHNYKHVKTKKSKYHRKTKININQCHLISQGIPKFYGVIKMSH